MTEPPRRQIAADPSRLAVSKGYVRNLADWLSPAARLSVAGTVGAELFRIGSGYSERASSEE